MSLTTASRTFQLLKDLFDVKTATKSYLPALGEKIPIVPGAVQDPLPRCAPEEEGISSDHIRRFLEEIGNSGDLYMQNVMILRHGKVLCEAAYQGQSLQTAKYTFSACKSVTSLAVGLLIDDGLLSINTKVVDLLEESGGSNAPRKLKNLTVEDLLTMRSGVQFTEGDSLTETDWIRGFLSASIKGEPGDEFHYNSLNTYILSVIVCRLTGGSMLQFLDQRLFKPMGITGVHWETCPLGYEKGGWGLYIRPEDMVKLGQLVMNEGQWNGKQLISRDYIRAATTAHATPPPNIGDFDYGYQIWIGRTEHAFLFNGMLGQNVLGYPESGIIIATNAGADTDYQESRYFEIVSRYFGGTFPESLPKDSAALDKLQETVRLFNAFHRPAVALSGRTAPFMHRCFSCNDPKSASTGLLPVTLQLLHNNYTSGLRSIAISEKNGVPELIYREQDAQYRFPIGLGHPVISQVTFRGDCYQISALGRFTHDEEERPVFYIRLEFMETPCVRTIKLIADKDQMILRQSETPGVPYIYNKLCAIANQPLYRPLLLVSLGGTEEDYLLYKTKQLLSPEIILTPDSK